MIGRFRRLLSAQRALSLGASELADLQTFKLRRTIKRAYESVPYYRSILDAASVKPSDIRTANDLRLIPITTKENLLRADPAELVACDLSAESLFESRTSGSSGQAFTVRRSLADVQTRKALDLRSLIAVGLRPTDKVATYTVRKPGSGRQPQKLFYRSKWISAIAPAEESAALLSRYDPDWLWCYPSSFRALLDHTDGRLHEICRPRGVVTAAERPDNHVQEACKSAGIQHFNFYGAVETGRIAWECRSHKGLHLNIDNIVLELLPMAVGGDGELDGLGETIVTTLNNDAMPFIRYRLGDLCRILDEPCPCGVALPLIAPPVGRTSDLVKLPSGRLLSARGLSALIRAQTGVREFLITQAKIDRLDVELIVDSTFDQEAGNAISASIDQYLEREMTVQVHRVDSIHRPGPKPKDFVSRVSSI